MFYKRFLALYKHGSIGYGQTERRKNFSISTDGIICETAALSNCSVQDVPRKKMIRLNSHDFLEISFTVWVSAFYGSLGVIVVIERDTARARFVSGEVRAIHIYKYRIFIVSIL